MSIQVVWDDASQTVIRHIYPSEQWTWDDLEPVLRQSRQMADGVDNSVDFIADFSDAQAVWLPRAPVSQFKSVRDFISHPQINRVVVVGAGMPIRVFTDLFRKVSPGMMNRVIFANTLAEARSLLGQDSQHSQNG